MSGLGFVVFFLVLLTVLGSVNFYAYRWTVRAFAPGEKTRRALALVLAASLLAMPLTRLLDRAVPGLPLRALVIGAGAIQLAVLLSFGLLLFVELAAGLARAVRALRPSRAEPALPARAEGTATEGEAVLAPEQPIERRALLQAAAGSAFLVGTGGSVYGVFEARAEHRIDEVSFRIPELAPALSGFTIVQLSDVHIGQLVQDRELVRARELVQRARPDLIVLTGDLLDNDPRLAPELGRFVRSLSGLARHGVAAVTGNHDFYAGITPFAAAVRGGGARLLRNEGIVVGDGSAGFALLGVDDVWARRRGGGPDLERAVASLPEVGGAGRSFELPRVLLCHNPTFFAEASGQVALQLSGHTHGGQINPGVRLADLVLPHGWVAGAYERDGSRLYVNRGYGTVGPPARLGAPPEVTRIVLTA